MRKEIKFDLFNEGETIYFNNGRLAQLEKAIGRSVMSSDFLSTAKLNFNETFAGLAIGLKHHYPKANLDFYYQKVDEYFDESGNGIEFISNLIIKAIIASGVHGKDLDDIINGGKDPAELETKNA